MDAILAKEGSMNAQWHLITWLHAHTTIYRKMLAELCGGISKNNNQKARGKQNNRDPTKYTNTGTQTLNNTAGPRYHKSKPQGDHEFITHIPQDISKSCK
jgi:hypothetical protein